MVANPAPMLAVSGQPPDDAARWAVEMKWDGVRAIVRIEAGTCRFTSRNARDISGSYPELGAALRALAPDFPLVIDGEIVAPEPGTGAPSFGRLQHRMHVVAPTAALLAAYPVEFIVFDVLEVDGESLLNRPYTERRETLAALELAGELVPVPPFWTGVRPAALLEVAAQHHLEGIVCKRLDSAYLPGRRSTSWIKTPLRRSTEAIVAGWLPGSGRFSGTFGSLVLAAHDGTGRLVHIGNVGTGFTAAVRRALQGRLDDLARASAPLDRVPVPSAVPGVHWVDPVLVGDVEFREASSSGLRHPSWRGLRVDKVADEVRVPF
ncbi:non-homologous end-joining DNA ligase [Nocardia sp. NPDC050697]|uniref:non-homologous end-joining DNA ligase n=1 Tax=Nocardia sp. NPDC050697 TaxID=3155158 RepID=UPI0033C704B3